MRLDLDKYRAAMALPTLVVDGVEYRATRLLSFNEVVRLQEKFTQAGGGGAAHLEIATEICDLSGIPPAVVVDLPPAAVGKVIAGFFAAANQQPEGESESA